MATDARQDLVRFHQFVTDQLETGGPTLSPEEAVEVWRLNNRTREEYLEDVAAIREAVEDLEAGKPGIPLSSFSKSFASGTIWTAAHEVCCFAFGTSSIRQ